MYIGMLELDGINVGFTNLRVKGFGGSLVCLDCEDELLKEKIKNRDESLWEILDILVGQEARDFHDALDFEEIVDSYDNPYDAFKRNFSEAYAIELIQNEFVDDKYKTYLHNYINGCYQQEVRIYKADAKERFGYVYLLRSESGLYKIGKALDVQKRFEQIQKETPYKLEIVYYFSSRDYSRQESVLLKKFAPKNKFGEWFALDEDDIDYIKSLESEHE